MTVTPPSEQPRVQLSRTATGDAVPPAAVRARRLDRLEDPVLGWFASISVLSLALFLRLWNLGNPKEFSFDETYYAKDAWSLANHGYIQSYVENADTKILDGHAGGQWTGDPSLAVHPEVGKWMIALGEKAFGMDPFGWRIASAIVGSLMVLIMVRLVRRLTGSTLLGCVAGLLLCFDGMHLVLSRLALLDIFLAFWLLLAVHCLVIDRDWMRGRLMTLDRDALAGWRPLLLWRPWLLLSGVCFGLACGTKWTPVYALAAFGLLVWFWSSGARRAAGTRMALVKGAVLDGVPAFFSLVGVAFLVYVGTWTGWLLNAHEYEEHLSATQYHRYVSGGHCADTDDDGEEELVGQKYDDDRRWSTAGHDAEGLGEVKQSLQSLWYYHQDVYTFHTVFLNCSTHTYESDPGSWPLLGRPVSATVENDIPRGEQGCLAPADSHCIREVLIIGTPMLWWGGALALMYAVVVWAFRRDWRFGLPVIGVLSTWLPWQLNDDRPIFLFYASAFLPFTVIAVTLTLGHILGRDPAGSTRRTVGTIIAGSFFVLVLLNFVWFWPIWTNELLTISEWHDRIWFRRWI